MFSFRIDQAMSVVSFELADRCGVMMRLMLQLANVHVLVPAKEMVMGMPFPSGLRQTGSGSLPAPPFYWGLNGIMSVIGSVVTVGMALMFGFQAAMIVGCVCYAVAGLVSRTALYAEDLP